MRASNKRLMEDIFVEWAKGDVRPLVNAMADDFNWIIAGSSIWSGTWRGKQAVLRDLLKPLGDRFSDTYKNEAHRFIAEGEYVVVECRGKVTTKSGLPYHNTYCMVCRLVDGKLSELIEYMDTELAASALGSP